VRYRVLFKLSNRQKKFADCTVRTVADVAGSYDDVAGLYADMWQAELVDSWQLDGRIIS
jgi:hypothetical protein